MIIPRYENKLISLDAEKRLPVIKLNVLMARG
jgi:hypothetical protein